MLPREHYLRQTFLDGVNFPDGFEKGGLSDIQARLIKKNGVLINALIADEVSDPTPEDLHILKVVANQSVPRSPVEQAWMKYMSIVQAKTTETTGTKKTKTDKNAPVTQSSIQQAILAATANRSNGAASEATPTDKPAKTTKASKAKATASGSNAVESQNVATEPAKTTKKAPATTKTKAVDDESKEPVTSKAKATASKVKTVTKAASAKIEKKTEDKKPTAKVVTKAEPKAKTTASPKKAAPKAAEVKTSPTAKKAPAKKLLLKNKTDSTSVLFF